MKKERALKEAKSILFVCYGNVCRSPMAEGMAKKILDKDVKIDSAGLSPILDGAAEEAIRIMRELYEIDISGHVPKNIVETPVREFNLIIILDTYVHNMIKKLAPDLGDQLLLWDIPDPYGRELDVFRSVAEMIWGNIQKELL
jgi:protein-tyrosine-phosphatase